MFLLLTICLVQAFREVPQNKYILVSTSKFWFNVRQSINTIMHYQNLKSYGVNDENIILMIPEDSACNRKNNVPGSICPFDDQIEPNLFKNIQQDYKRDDVNINNWINIMRGKYNQYTPQSRRLKLNKESKFLMLLTGHGGDGYTKMQHTQYLLDFEMAKITKEMAFLEIYQEAFLISDSCGAVTLYEEVTAPNMLLLGSSSREQKSYSKGRDSKLMMAKSDRFSYVMSEFVQKRLSKDINVSLEEFLKIFTKEEQGADIKLINTGNRRARDIKIAEYLRQKPRQYLQIMRRKNQRNKAKSQFIEQFRK